MGNLNKKIGEIVIYCDGVKNIIELNQATPIAFTDNGILFIPDKITEIYKEWFINGIIKNLESKVKEFLSITNNYNDDKNNENIEVKTINTYSLFKEEIKKNPPKILYIADIYMNTIIEEFKFELCEKWSIE